MPAVRAMLAAIAFLTRIPLGRVADLDGRDVARGAALFPLVGAGVGALGGLVADGLADRVPTLAAAGLALLLVALLTGAMHLDALADAADALGGTTRERRLEIMRDHAIGSFGAVALVLVVLVEASALAALAVDGHATAAFAAAGACSRWASLPLAAALPPARAGGQGRSLAAGGRWGAALLGLVLAAAVSVAAVGTDAALALGAAAATALVLGLWFRRWIGGVTGDTL